MNTNFFFMDDSTSWTLNDGIRMSAITGLIIPISDFTKLEGRFYEMQRKWIVPAPNTIDNPPELHGNNMLPGKPDDVKLEEYSKIVSFILNNKIPLYRVGYYQTEEDRTRFRFDTKYLNLCWFSMLAVLQPHYAEEYIIPVMDHCNSKEIEWFAPMVRQLGIHRAVHDERNLSIQNTENILGEVFFADSRYSNFIQIADVAGYLLMQCDMEREGRKTSPFKRQILEISKGLDEAIVYNCMIQMRELDTKGETVNGPLKQNIIVDNRAKFFGWEDK